MLKKEEILKTVQEILVEQLGSFRCRNLEALPLETNLRDDLNVDSLDMCIILVAIEDKLGIDIPIEKQNQIMEKPTIQIIIDIADELICKKK